MLIKKKVFWHRLELAWNLEVLNWLLVLVKHCSCQSVTVFFIQFQPPKPFFSSCWLLNFISLTSILTRGYILFFVLFFFLMRIELDFEVYRFIFLNSNVVRVSFYSMSTGVLRLITTGYILPVCMYESTFHFVFWEYISLNYMNRYMDHTYSWLIFI